MQNREICEGSQKAKSFLFETAFIKCEAILKLNDRTPALVHCA